MTVVTTAPTIEERLDRMALQLETISGELERQRRASERWSELTEDVTPIARGALVSVSSRLEELDIDLDQITGFLEVLARSLPTLERLMAQVQPLSELAETAMPFARPAMDKAIESFGELDRRGYFDFAERGLGVVDRVVTSFTEEDIDALGDNVVLILQTVKEMTQPQVMQMLQRTFTTVQKREMQEASEPPGAIALLKQMRDPQVRRGLNKVLHMLSSVGEEAADGAKSESRR
ncbi:MAG: DUF1641 domain-containing protein [Acidimicrobiia bacterium]|nr:DUF1641 domain-containing protein [Acidimicrobiia bacterium]